MKVLSFLLPLGLIISIAGAAPTLADKNDKKPNEKTERSTAVDPKVTVTLCVMSGTISVHAWDKSEVRVRALDVEEIELRRIDKTKEVSGPPTRIDVMIYDGSQKFNKKADCRASADVDMDVPHGATIQVQTRDGDINIEGVAAAYAGSQNGDISIERASRLVEAGSVGGSISLKDSTGRINLSSAGGGVEVTNVRPAEGGDSCEVGTVSGDIRLDRVSNANVIAKTVNGTVSMTGPLARKGSYSFTTMSGDVVLAMPSDASFQLNAKISETSDIVSDFALKMTPEPMPPVPAPKPAPQGKPTAPPAKTPAPIAKSGTAAPVVAPVIVKPSVVVVPYAVRRIYAIHGSGDATISVASFGGTLRLKKLG
ncbi:MAG TPA: DUF4097 family beta strand repeat-containing protein [Pyrinomonadaceae bacterium]|nr:DUF4097 family beta strand repeat-containing protein [Pyrinomonadaceae bacterium]